MILIVVGAAVLGLVVAIAVLTQVVLPRLRPEPAARPDYAPGELTPAESTVVAQIQPDGTVRVDQVLIFDAGPGTTFPATWFLGGTRVGESADESVRFGVVPKVISTSARAVPRADAPVPLEITVDESDYDDPFDDGRRYRLAATDPWAPGRHRVEFSFVLGDVWVQASGVRLLVLPLRFASAPDTGQPADLVRLTVRGAPRLDCPDRDEPFADRPRCGQGDRLVYHPAELRTLEAVTVNDPGFVEAAPIPIAEKAR